MGAFRLFLACLVILCHTTGYDLSRFPDTGGIAVSVFFFISGYLMPLAFNSNYRFPRFRDRVKNYAVNRILRIYPMYWASLLIILVHGRLRPTQASLAAYEHPLILLQNFMLLGLNQSAFWGHYIRLNNPAWTLDVELQYYLLVPFLLLFWEKAKAAVAALLIILSLLSFYLMASPRGLVDVDRSLAAWAALFFGGFFCYHARRFRALFSGAAPAWLGTALALAALPFGGEVRTVTITIGLLLVACHLIVKQTNRSFSKLDMRLGDLSYPVYIFHLMILESVDYRLARVLVPLVSAPGLRLFALALSNIALSISGAYAAFWLMEHPIERLRTAFKRDCSIRNVGAAA